MMEKRGLGLFLLTLLVIFQSLPSAVPTDADDVGWTCDFEDGDLCGWVAENLEDSGNGWKVEDVSLGEIRMMNDGSLGQPFASHRPEKELVFQRDHHHHPPDSAPSSNSVSAFVVSPLLGISQNCVVGLRYAIQGISSALRLQQIDAMTLKVIAEDFLSGPQIPAVQWHSHHSRFSHHHQPFYVILEGSLPEGGGGSVRISHLTLSVGCRPLWSQMPTTVDLIRALSHDTSQVPREDTISGRRKDCALLQYSCYFSELCIPNSKVCDFTKDCPQGDDETQCGATDFEHDLGGWKDTSYDNLQYKWKRVSVTDAHDLGGTAPDHDHTYPTNNTGYFMWASGSNIDDWSATGIVKSANFGPTSIMCTAVLWVSAAGGNPGLRFIINLQSETWVSQGDIPEAATAEWRLYSFVIGGYHEKASMQIISNWDESSDGLSHDVCIDDVQLIGCDPNTPPTKDNVICTFSDPCGLYQSHDDDSGWSHDYDYIHPENMYMQSYGETVGAVLLTWWRVPSPLFCVSFRYVVFNRASLNVKLVTKNQDEKVWEKNQESDNLYDWRAQHLQLSSDDANYQIHFTSVSQADSYAVYLDDVDIFDGPCPASFFCSFDDKSEMCDWSNFNNGDAELTWTLGSGSDGVANAPWVDHTMGTALGHYQYLKLQTGESSKRAYLRSPEIMTTSPEGDCFHFWFYAYSSSSEAVGELGVRLFTSEVSDRIWDCTYNFVDSWQFGEVTIKHEKNFSILLEGLRRDGNEGSLAWDDLWVSRGVCETPASCSFEHGFCGWLDEGSLEGSYPPNNWVLIRGEEQLGSGPNIDHTTLSGKGHYIIADISECMSYVDDCYAIVESPVMSPTEDHYCFAFYLNALHFGADNLLKVEIIDILGSTSTTAAVLSTDPEQAWIYHRVHLYNLNFFYHIRLHAQAFSKIIDGSAYIALDDFELLPGDFCYYNPGSSMGPITSPKPDEQLTCDFEGMSSCGWKQPTTDGGDWLIVTGDTVADGPFDSKYGPVTDHTTHLSGGHFMFVSSNMGSEISITLKSEDLLIDESGLCFSFYNYISGLDPPLLTLWLFRDDTSKKPSWESGQTGDVWKQVKLHIPYTENSSSYILFEAILNKNDDLDLGHTALDDILAVVGSCNKYVEGILCEFETSDQCEFLSMTVSGSGGWEWRKGADSEDMGPPTSDHTYGNKGGHFVQLRSTQGDTLSYFSSPLLQGTGDVQCLEWYYYMDGKTSMNNTYLKLYIQPSGSNLDDLYPVWTVNDPEGSSWNLGHITINQPDTYYIVFMGYVGQLSDEPIIALDDIATNERECPAPATCTFENGNCDWTSLPDDNIQWVMNSGPTHTENTGPPFDHTLLSPQGHYTYVDASEGFPGAIARLQSVLLPAGDYCFEFYYCMNGRNMGSLAVNLLNAIEFHMLFNKTGDQGVKWYLGRAPISEKTPFRLQFVVTVGTGVESDVAIDDTWTSYGSCKNPPGQFVCGDGTLISSDLQCNFIADCSDMTDEDSCGNCDFETGMCGWTALNSTDFLWKVGQNLTDDEGGENIFDHTIGTASGHMLYVDQEPSDNQGPAVIVTNAHRNAHVDCTLKFWYRQAANTFLGEMTELHISIERDGERTPLSYFINDGRAAWREASVYLLDWLGEFAIRIEGTTTAGPSDLTLDDLDFYDCAVTTHFEDCLPEQVQCSYTGWCVSSDVTCDNTNDCGDMTDEENCEDYLPICTFEENQPCDWEQETHQDDNNWLLASGSTPAGVHSHLTGPSADHTTRLPIGHYYYATTKTYKHSMKRTTQRAWFMSPILQTKMNRKCVLRFHYYMYGEHIDELNVYLRSSIYGGETVAFSRRGDQGQVWNRGVVFSSINDPFQFIIEGITNNEDYSDIAIDDLSFSVGCTLTNGSLPEGSTPLPTHSPCQNDQFYCGVGDECIQASKQCNWVSDCSNNADEKDCGACDFESGLCSWEDGSSGTYRWQRLRAGQNSPYDHPYYDHTNRNSTGHYVYIESYEGVIGHTAVLTSPALLQSTSYYCEINMWLFLKNHMNIDLSLFYYDVINDIKILLYNLSSSTPQEDNWYRVTVPATYIPIQSSISFEGRPVFQDSFNWTESHSIAAVDDIEFFNCDNAFRSLDCNFDDLDHYHGFCMWRQSSDDEQDWKKNDKFPEDLPDHTTGETFYIFVDFNDPKAHNGDRAKLVSNVQSKKAGDKTLFTLWYYFFGENVGKFRLLQRTERPDGDSSEDKVIFELLDSKEDRWMLLEKELEVDDDFSIALEATWEEIGPGLLAIDDILLLTVVHQPLCDFEVDFCQWVQDGADDTDWVRAYGDQHIHGSPSVDHTTNTGMGYYAFLQPLDKYGSVGYLSSPVYESVGFQCLRFWYHMKGNNIGFLSVTVEDQFDPNISVHLWSNNMTMYEMWALGQVTVPNLQKYLVHFKGITGTNDSLVGLDDIEFVPGVCPRDHVCNFESGLCDWYNVDNGEDSFDWVRVSGADGYGPIVDHTLNYESGHYMLIQLEDQKKGDSAKLYGASVPADHSCITLWYSMQYIVNVTLSVVLLTEGEEINLINLYNSTLDLLWEEITLKQEELLETFVIMLKLLVEEDLNFPQYDAVAVDDIAFTIDCKPTLPPILTTPVPTHYSSVYDCDFEQEDKQTCNWIQEPKGRLNWTLWQGPTPTEETGPAMDHTTQTEDGHYIYVSTKDDLEHQATLISPYISVGASGACLSFWYHMHGFNIGKLDVALQSDEVPKKVIWQRSHEQGRKWLQAKIHVTDRRLLRMIVEATPSYRGKGDIALDDITLDFGPCNTGNLCDFEAGMCNFEHSLEGSLQWELITTSNTSDAYPSYDHSQQTLNGHFLGMDSAGTAMVYTNIINPRYKCVEFWVYFSENQYFEQVELSVFKRIGLELDSLPLLRIKGMVSNKWNRYILPVESSEYYSLGFQGKSSVSVVAGIDDIQPLMSCEAPYECNFEKDLCTWENNAKSDDFDWSQTTSEHLSSIYAPKVDVTLKSPYGGFVYVDLSEEGNVANTTYAYLELDTLEAETWCISFWLHYQVLGEPSINLTTHTEFGENKVLWSHKDTIHADWKFEQVPFTVLDPTAESQTSLRFVVEKYNYLIGIIALDQVKVDPGECKNSTVPDCIITCDFGVCITPADMCNFIQDCSQGQDEKFCGYNCTFEASDGDHCTWKNMDFNGDFSWILLQGLNDTAFGPSVDHTFLTSAGYYMAVSHGIMHGQVDHAPILLSPTLFNSAADCHMTFWYVIYEVPSDISTNVVSTLTVSYNVNDISTELLQLKATNREEWMNGFAYLGRIRTEFTVELEGKRNWEIEGYIAVDDILFEDCFLPSPQVEMCNDFLCENQACISSFAVCDFVDDCGDDSDEISIVANCGNYYARCNFENDACLWEEEGRNWHHGSPSTDNTVPSRDHTLNTAEGSFLYIESSESSLEATKALLYSPVVTGVTAFCVLRFFYYSDGPSVDKIIVSTRDALNVPLKERFKIIGPVGPYWERAEVMIEGYEVDFKLQQFVISAYTLNYTSGFSSVIAIDDISFTEGCVSTSEILPTVTYPSTFTTEDPCNNGFHCENGNCVTLSQVCDFSDDCGDQSDETQCAACDFHTDQCGWEDTNHGHYYWAREAVGLVSKGSSGFIMTVKESVDGIGDLADLESVTLGPTSSTCTVSFDYRKQGEGSVLELNLVTGTMEITLWYVFVDMGSNWHHQTVGIMAHSAGWKLRFRANIEGELYHIMIDNIEFQDCVPPTPTVCQDDEFLCDNHICVNQSQLCDFSNDCGDGSDEGDVVCLMYEERCNFESDFCDWEQDTQDDLDWMRKTGEMLSQETGPDYDHTYGNETGYYMYLQSVEGSRGKHGVVSSVSYYPTSGDKCHFRFWYIMRGDQNIVLTVLVQETSKNATKKDSVVFQTNGTDSYLWTLQDTPISFSRYFRVRIDGAVGNPIDGDIAIDDLSFGKDCFRLSCPDGQSPCLSGPGCVAPAEICNFHYDCSDHSDENGCPFDCGFEHDSCGWTDSSAGAVKWIPAKADDPIVGTDVTGPPDDATGDEYGHFLLLYRGSGSVADGQKSEAFSHWYQNSAPECTYSYYYYLDKYLGSDVIMRLNSSSDAFTILTSFGDDILIGQTRWWFMETVGIGRHKDPFQLSLFKEGDGYTGIFALDELIMNDCDYPLPTIGDCSPTQYHCPLTQICIENDVLCDLSDNCGDGEDETKELCKSYHQITFEDSSFGWFSQAQNGVVDDTDWLLGSGDSVSSKAAPTFDHTLWTHKGHFLYVDVPATGGVTAQLISDPIIAGPSCSFVLHYHINGLEIGNLTVVIREEDGTPDRTVFIALGIFNGWRKKRVTSDDLPLGRPFQIVISGMTNENQQGAIAVDDFILSPDCKLSATSTLSPPFTQPTNGTCSADEFVCSDGTCLPRKNRCNFVSNCPNGDTADEDGCVSEKCTFEGKDLCGWKIEASSHLQMDLDRDSSQKVRTDSVLFTWELSRGKDTVAAPVGDYKPLVDHTNGDDTSYYVFASVVDGTYEDSTNLTTPDYIGETGANCRFSFWYWLEGPMSGLLEVLVTPLHDDPEVVWFKEGGDHGHLWHRAEISLIHLTTQMLSIQAHRGTSYEGAAAIDDVHFIDCAPPSPPPEGMTCEESNKYTCKTGTCVDKSDVCDYSNDCLDKSDELYGNCITYKFRCNFEIGLCSHWKEDIEDTTDWVLRVALSGSAGDLPTHDHTMDSAMGHYITLDTSSPSDTEYVGRLHSPVISGTVEECELRFWYQAIGDNPGVINVYRRKSYYDDGLRLEATLNNTEKNVWVRFVLPFGDVTPQEDFQVVIEGVVTADHEGTLALDDFSMTPLCEMSSNQNLPGQDEITTPAPPCLPGELGCNNGKCYHPTEACNFRDDCGDGTDEQDCSKDCDFEEDDLCGWFESLASSAHWVRTGFPVPSPGPSADHNGRDDTHDLLTSKTTEVGGQVSILETRTISAVDHACNLVFYLYMANDGSDEPFISLYQKTEEDSANGKPPDQLYEEWSSSWMWSKKIVRIPRKRDFTVYFKVVHGKGKSYVALDDITFEHCSPPTSQECHSSTDFQCVDGSCVPRQFACDAKYDCPDKSDEFNCTAVKGNCNFDGEWTEECLWQQSSDDDLQWSWDTSSHDPNYGPAHDHTLGHHGHYVYVGSKTTPRDLLASIMTNNMYPPSTDICYIRFWYYKHTETDPSQPVPDTGSLTVYREELHGRRWVITTRGKNYDAAWQEAVVLVSSDVRYRVVFEVKTGDPEYTYIALDDVSFTPECESGVSPPEHNVTCDPVEKQCSSGECLPKDFFCDCFIDCIDGSDETNCDTTCSTIVTRPTFTTTTGPTTTAGSTTTTTRDPYACTDTEFSCNDVDHTCLPALLLCDGVTDCPNAADELQCPEKTPCDPGFIYCADFFMIEHPCFPVEDLCDGIIKCNTYHADESVCGNCPSYFCLNRGQCQLTNNQAPSCNCRNKYSGNRCELHAGSNLSAGDIVGIVFGTIFGVVIIAGAIFYVWKQKREYGGQHVLLEESHEDEDNELRFGASYSSIGHTNETLVLEDMDTPQYPGYSNDGFRLPTASATSGENLDSSA